MPGNTTIPLGGTFYTPSSSFDKVQVAGTVVVDSTRSASFLNVFSSNAVTTTNVFANTLTMSNATSTINVTGNIYASNAVTTTNLFTAGITSNVTSTIFNSDTLTIPFVYSTTLNVASTSNLFTAEMQGSLGATTLRVTGNAFVSNALTTANVFATGQVVATGKTGAGVCPPLVYRQGGDATNWNTAGTTNYALTAGIVQMQSGTLTMSASPQTVTFPVAYTGNPTVMITPYGTSTTPAYVSAVTTSNFQVTCPSNITIEWLAIGI
jgi:hypothetical protein